VRKCTFYVITTGFTHVQSEMLRDLTEEYSDVIIASFAGHSHTSWFTALRDRATAPSRCRLSTSLEGAVPITVH